MTRWYCKKISITYNLDLSLLIGIHPCFLLMSSRHVGSILLCSARFRFIDGHKRKNRMELSHARVSIVVNVFMPSDITRRARFELNSGPLEARNALCPIKHIQHSLVFRRQ